MRISILVFTLALSAVAWGSKKEINLAKIVYEQKNSRDIFVLKKSRSAYLLTRSSKARGNATIKLKKEEAELLRDEVARTVWASLYRKPASIKKCTTYATMESVADKTTICLENVDATNRSYDLLLRMAKRLEK